MFFVGSECAISSILIYYWHDVQKHNWGFIHHANGWYVSFSFVKWSGDKLKNTIGDNKILFLFMWKWLGIRWNNLPAGNVSHEICSYQFGDGPGRRAHRVFLVPMENATSMLFKQRIRIWLNFLVFIPPGSFVLLRCAQLDWDNFLPYIPFVFLSIFITISRIHRLVFKHAQLLRDCCSVIKRDTFFLIIMYWAALTV